MSRALNLNDLTYKTGSKFVPHVSVPIPELQGPGDVEPPVVYLISPSAGKVLAIGSATKLKSSQKSKEGSAGDEQQSIEDNTNMMIDLIIECARTQDGDPLCATADDVRSLPSFVFNRIVRAINSFMSLTVGEDAGKD